LGLLPVLVLLVPLLLLLSLLLPARPSHTIGQLRGASSHLQASCCPFGLQLDQQQQALLPVVWRLPLLPARPSRTIGQLRGASSHLPASCCPFALQLEQRRQALLLALLRQASQPSSQLLVSTAQAA
jgi:hypothetical protein